MATLQADVAEAVRTHGVAGAVAARSDNGGRQYGAAGVADADVAGPMTLDTGVRVASLSKPMLAIALLMATRHRPELLRAPLVELLPELRPMWRVAPDLCLRDVLSHTGGLQPDLPMETLHWFGDGDGALIDAVSAVVGGGPAFRARSAWQYCNGGYWLAGAALAKLRESSFEDAMTEMLFGPLGMTRSGFRWTGPRPAAGHRGGEVMQEEFPRARRPSGGVWSTVSDLLVFAEFMLEHWQGELHLGRAAEPIATTRWGTRYGIGWETTGPRRPLVWHDGDWGGFRSRMVVAPADRQACVAVVNDAAGGPVLDQVAPLASATARAPGVARRLAGMAHAATRLTVARSRH